MKKITILYLALAVTAGLAFGYFLFHSPEAQSSGPSAEASDTSQQLWTCAMHPQIQLPQPGNCPICGMELIPVEGTEMAMDNSRVSMTEYAAALAHVQTMVAGSLKGTPERLVLSGKIRENEEANAIQASYFDGRLEHLYVNTTGENVQVGQRVATIYSPELVAAQQELLSSRALKSSQPALYEAVRNKLKFWKLSEEQIQTIESSGKVQEYFPVYATVSGTVTGKMVQEGDYVKKGQPLFKIAGLATVWAVFDAYENQLPFLKRGQEVLITSEAYPNEQMTGAITFINPVMDTSSRTVEVRAVLQNNSGKLKPGMFVKGQVIDGGAAAGSEGIWLPSSAVLWTGERSLVYVKPNPDKSEFEMREVTLGKTAGDDVQILQGLEAGEEVVVNGTFTVDAAAQLKGKRSMMNPEGETPGSGAEGTMQMPMEGH